MKRLIGIVAVVLAAAAVLTIAGCSGKPKDLTLGYIMPGPDPWYGYAKDGFVFAGEKNGVKVQVVNSDYDQQKEQANIDDLITKQVSGINLFSFNADAAQIAAQKANKAKIPLTIEMTALAQGSGTIVTDVEFDWVRLGEMLAEKIAEKFPGEKVLEITGIVGTGPIDSMLSGLKGKMAEIGKNELIGIQPADYNREKAMNIMQNMLASKKQFTVVHVANEDMAMGVIQVLKDAKKLNNPIKVVSNNGSPEGLESIKAGELSFTFSTSPGVEGLTSFEAIYRHLRGKKVPAKVMIPILYIDKANVEQAVAWKVDEKAYELVKKLYDDLGAK